ncbi:hypothetical protein Aconfl_39800 [Algoriphagus confluentis]|uniref:Secreted protein n=1 Tax=Algoriphagus confluentis TaxID=1697556 RepID=A0ABQ6PUN8_9BACT|nr:hypothetical protein Aconfl_39800 [Algoriphagus confluentis]
MKLKTNFAAKLGFAALVGSLLGLYPMTSQGDVSLESEIRFISWCQHNVDGNSGISNTCVINQCKSLTGQGSNVGPCGDAASLD